VDEEIKRRFIERQKRLFFNILRQLEKGLSKGVTDEALVNQFKLRYNEIVYEDAKKAYLEHKMRQAKRVNYFDELFTSD